MRPKEIALSVQGFLSYMSGSDILRTAETNAQTIISKETDEKIPLPFFELSPKGTLRVLAEYAKAMEKATYTLPLRWFGIDGLVKLSRRMRQRSAS